jgi:hypothetical protein
MALLGAATLSGQKIPPQKPRLIVGITVSGMQYDYLSVYWDKFGEGSKRWPPPGRTARMPGTVT